MNIEKIRKNLIIGFMFLGMGIGMLFNNFMFGLFVGLGIGFIITSFIEKKKPLNINKNPKYVKLLVGIFFLVIGIAELMGYEIPWRYMSSIALLLIGLYFILTTLEK
ncbi:hypothetical protein [Methanotorris formicicus]|uniref:Uncharacterized protein n=1 Tax=Methanotorris formicicus Mc-S-70 TaxID=647171 RepID=H1KWK5_9EURY|nr:hypothetical protein [Methanotorris formicicus]EHP89582.1 hypothetical protein MetfoDRAFT_0178 [Methanotorris formicicus Mc-S-70]